jgi:hypothetical protein
LVPFAWFRVFDERFYDNPMFHQLTAMRLMEAAPSARRHLHTALVVAAGVGIVGALWALLHIYFAYGLASAKVRGWPARSVPQIPFQKLQAWLEHPGGPDPTTLTAMAVGAAVMAWVLKWLTLRYGGIHLYRRVLPFALGMILGDYIVPLGWAIYGVIVGQQMYLAYPH